MTACWQPRTGAPPEDAATEVGAPDAATQRLEFTGASMVTARMETLSYPTTLSLEITGTTVRGSFTIGSLYAGTIAGSVSARTLTLSWPLTAPCAGGNLFGTAELTMNGRRLIGSVRGSAPCTVMLESSFDLSATGM